MPNKLIYIDESGDLGFKFDKPFLSGGSSRFFTLAAIVTPRGGEEDLKRLVRGIYKNRKRASRNELKAPSLSNQEQKQIISTFQKLKYDRHFEFYSITVLKSNVDETLRSNTNALYNYLMKTLLLEPLAYSETLDFFPDNRELKNGLTHQLPEYLAQSFYEKAFENNKKCPKVTVSPLESRHHLELQAADYLAHFVWKTSENRTIPTKDLQNLMTQCCEI